MSDVPPKRPGYDPPMRLRGMPSWLVAQAARHASQLVDDALAREGMRKQEFAVLTSLSEQGAASQAEIGRRVWIDRSDLHAILNGLESAGFVKRVPDQQDRRRKLVELSQPGRTALKRLDQQVDAAQTQLLAPLGRDEQRALLRLLNQLVDRH